MKTMKKLILMLLLVGAIFILFPKSLAEAAELNFSVKAILPDNQHDKDKTHFDLRMEPGQEQTIEVEVKNLSDKAIKVYMNPSTAITNLNGVIDYPNPKTEIKYDESLKYPFSTIAKMAESVELSANETKKVPIKLTLPNTAFDGVIIGALRFYEEDTEKQEATQEKKGMGVRNRFDYLVGVKISENDKEVSPDLAILSVKAGQVNYRNAVNVKLQNPQPVILENLSIETEIYPKNSNTASYKQSKDHMRMAPNSNMEFPIYLMNKAFKPGKYLMKLQATDGEQKWSFTKEFEITKEEADKFNEESAVELDKEINWPLYIGIGIAIIVILLTIIFFLLIHKKKRKPTSSKHPSQKKGKKQSTKKRKHTKK